MGTFPRRSPNVFQERSIVTGSSSKKAVWVRRLPDLILAGPAVVIFVGLFVIPMMLAFVLSLTDWNGFSLNFTFVGFENYFAAFTGSRSISAAMFTLFLSFIGTVLCNAVGLGLAVLISGQGIANTIARTIFFYPFIISALIIGFLWSAILSPSGVVNNLLEQWGFSTAPFLTDGDWARGAVVFTVVWSAFGFSMILYIAGLKSIPVEYYEASTIDGAGSWAQFCYITFPMLAPVVTVNLVLTVVGFLKIYDVVLALTNGGPAGSTQTVVYQILKESLENGRLGLGAAQSVILLVVTAILGLAVVALRRRAEEKVSA